MMKSKIFLIIAGATALAACTTGQTRIGNYGATELQKIKHLCILENPKAPQPEFTQNIRTALEKQGISSETVNILTERKRLYEPECRYNLRHSGKPGQNISLLIRTPDHPVASLRDTMKPAQDLQKQTDSLIARLLGKSTQ